MKNSKVSFKIICQLFCKVFNWQRSNTQASTFTIILIPERSTYFHDTVGKLTFFMPKDVAKLCASRSFCSRAFMLCDMWASWLMWQFWLQRKKKRFRAYKHFTATSMYELKACNDRLQFSSLFTEAIKTLQHASSFTVSDITFCYMFIKMKPFWVEATRKIWFFRVKVLI